MDAEVLERQSGCLPEVSFEQVRASVVQRAHAELVADPFANRYSGGTR